MKISQRLCILKPTRNKNRSEKNTDQRRIPIRKEHRTEVEPEAAQKRNAKKKDQIGQPPDKPLKTKRNLTVKGLGGEGQGGNFVMKDAFQ